jgi:asparagine synthase (glutamine-hydrolysing)
MCGIAGIYCFEAGEPDPSELTRMTEVIRHRGPDDVGYHIETHIGLGFRRLSIIDLAEGHQPLSNEDESVWIVFNGEIYNYKELRERLAGLGHTFRTNSDTEVIVHLYEEYGDKCVDYLRGMFAFVIWDRRNRQLFGARDPFGIKPFYYYTNKGRFLFASEIKSLLASGGIRRTVRTESLLNYLSFQFVPEPNTMLEGIYKLAPGHWVKVAPDGRVSLQRYWDPMLEPDRRPFADYVEEVRETVKESVRAHMVSDVERGCFLSSGIDSTAIAAGMKAIEPIRTFSVGFAGPNNETGVAAQTAEALGTEHYAKLITQGDFFAALPKAIWHQDEPVADPSAIALYHVAQLAREHVTVVLSGEGADELFGGYRIYREPLALRPLSWMPLPAKRLLHRLAQLLPAGLTGRNYILRGTTPLEERFIGNAKIFTEDMKAELLQVGRELLEGYHNPLDIAGKFYGRTKHLDPVSRMQYIDLNLWLPGDILMKADKMTMAHSLELRVPFLDRKLFDVARRIPYDYKTAKGTTKYVFRKAMEGIVPDFVLHRPKLGFPVPLRDWLREGELGGTMLEQIKGSGIDSFIQLKEAERMLQLHRNGQGDYSRRLWAVYIFALWHAAFLQEANRPAFAV